MGPSGGGEIAKKWDQFLICKLAHYREKDSLALSKEEVSDYSLCWRNSCFQEISILSIVEGLLSIKILSDYSCDIIIHSLHRKETIGPCIQQNLICTR